MKWIIGICLLGFLQNGIPQGLTELKLFFSRLILLAVNENEWFKLFANKCRVIDPMPSSQGWLAAQRKMLFHNHRLYFGQPVTGKVQDIFLGGQNESW